MQYVVERIRDGEPFSRPAPLRIAEGIADYLELVSSERYRVVPVTIEPPALYLSEEQQSAIADAFARVQ
jgi:hypothetical protein